MQYHHLCTNSMIVSPRARYHSASSFWFSVGILIISERHYRRPEIFSFLTLFRSSELNICLHWVIECRSHLVLVTVIASCEYAMMLIKDFLVLIWTAIKIYIYIYISGTNKITTRFLPLRNPILFITKPLHLISNFNIKIICSSAKVYSHTHIHSV